MRVIGISLIISVVENIRGLSVLAYHFFEGFSGVETILSGYNPSSICTLITKKQLFIDNNIFFMKGITHQDIELTYRLMPCVAKVVFSDIIPYLYIYHPNSTSKSMVPENKIKYIKDDIYIINSFRRLALSFKDINPQLYRVIFNRSQNVLFGLVYSLYKNKKEWGNLVSILLL